MAGFDKRRQKMADFGMRQHASQTHTAASRWS